MQRNPRPIGLAAGLAVLALVLGLTGCSRTPDLGTGAAPDLEDADYPALIPLDSVLGPPPDPQAEAEKLAEALNRRRDALRARAQRLTGPVVDAATEQRMSDTPGE